MAKVTLKQIAQAAGVSLTTVHRVLNGKGGCSQAVEENILRIAREQGYTVNSPAPSVAEAPLHIALVFPMIGNMSRFFLDRILQGYLTYRRESIQMNVVFQEFYCGLDQGLQDAYSEAEEILARIYREQPMRYDGVVVYGIGMTPRTEALINRIVGSGTRVVVMEYCPEGLEDVCSTEVDEVIAGNLAGDVLAHRVHSSGTVLIIRRNWSGEDGNAEVCARCIRELRPDLKVEFGTLPLDRSREEYLETLLRQYPDLRGVYATSAYQTHSLLNALKKTGIRLESVIGSELFEESYQALQDRTLSAVIDKHPEQIGYKALQLLMGALLREEELPAVYRVTPRIILRANSDVYYTKKENLYGKTNYPE